MFYDAYFNMLQSHHSPYADPYNESVHILFFFLLQEGKIAGRAILIAGHPGTGKTAIAMGMQ